MLTIPEILTNYAEIHALPAENLVLRGADIINRATGAYVTCYLEAVQEVIGAITTK